jgi:hypothetical protein
MQFLDVTQALATAGIYAGIAIVGGLFVFHLATYKPTLATPTPAPQPEPTPEVEPEPVVEPDPIVEPTPEVEPEVIEPETEPEPIVDRVEELFEEYRGMTLRALRKEVKGRVRGIRSLTRDDLALRLAEAVAAA